MNPLYKIQTREIGASTCVSVLCKRGNLEVSSSEKVIPPIVEYNEKGEFTVSGVKQVLQGVHRHPYKARSSDFSKERLADVEVYNLYKFLEHFPTLPTIRVGNEDVPHPVAELIYASIVYLKPSEELDKKLKKIGYLKRSKLLPPILEKVKQGVFREYGIVLDLHSVPKRDVGTFCYTADDEGYAIPAKDLTFGFHKAIPRDRLARELSSFKACEQFISPEPVRGLKNKSLAPFISTLRVAIIGTASPMLDSGDLFPSSLPKIASVLSRLKIEKDLEQIPKDERNLRMYPSRSGIEIVHEEDISIDESIEVPATIRLIFPGGVKVAAQVNMDEQASDNLGKIDMLLDFRTVADKGAIALFGIMAGLEGEPTLQDCLDAFNNMQTSVIKLGDQEYDGYVGTLPVIRPGQRYTELSKGSNNITVDLISKAILSKSYEVRNSVEEEYQLLSKLRKALGKEIMCIN